MKRSNRRIHKGWIVLAITVLNIFACLGLARFSFAVILPAMKDGSMLTITQAGLAASAMFFGYMASALLTGKLVHRYQEKKVIIVSMVFIVIGMLVCATANQFWLVYLSCMIMGAGSGAGNITSLGVAGKWFTASQRGKALGVTNSGSGLGMVFSGFVLPFVLLFNAEGWRFGWGILALCVICIIVINILFLVESPEKLNVKPIGGAKKESRFQTGSEFKIYDVYRNKYIFILGMVYFTWGFSYLIFSTFFVDYAIAEVNIAMEAAGSLFAIAGLSSIISGFIWGSISDRFGRMLTLFLIFFIQSLLLTAFALTSSFSGLLIETIGYALTLWAVPTVIVAAVNDMTTTAKVPLAIGFITLFFGIGQWISPMLTGSMVENIGYTLAFFLSAAVCFIGSLGCIGLHLALQREQQKWSLKKQQELR